MGVARMALIFMAPRFANKFTKRKPRFFAIASFPTGLHGHLMGKKIPRNLRMHPHICPMNRRQFTRSLAALGLAPALPVLPSAASATTAAAPAYTPYMYGLGAHIARSIGLCSAELLARKLALTPAVARTMQAQLVANGVLSAPNTAGLAVAAKPYMASVRFKTTSATTAKMARHFIADAVNPTDDVPESEPTAEAEPQHD